MGKINHFNKVFLITKKFKLYKIYNLIYILVKKNLINKYKNLLSIITKKYLYINNFWKYNYIIIRYNFNNFKKNIIKVLTFNKKFFLLNKFSCKYNFKNFNRYYLKNNNLFTWPFFIKTKKKEFLIYNIILNKYITFKIKKNNYYYSIKQKYIYNNLYNLPILKKNYKIFSNKSLKNKFNKYKFILKNIISKNHIFKKIYNLFIFWFLQLNNNIGKLINNYKFFNWCKYFYTLIINKYNNLYINLYINNFFKKENNVKFILNNYFDISNKKYLYKINYIYKSNFLLNKLYSKKIKFNNKLIIK